jgi:hypothetical protein|eukprot:scaffold116_cov235-Chaetoceros_neogracile.AAC.6
MSDNVIYSELYPPFFKAFVFFMPMFYTYGITIQEKNTNKNKGVDSLDKSITFGYGWAGPNGITAHTTSLQNIDPASVITGTATGRENLIRFGGWGIRYSPIHKTWAYNARNGPYVEFEEICCSKTTRYRIASENPDEVASKLRGEKL